MLIITKIVIMIFNHHAFANDLDSNLKKSENRTAIEMGLVQSISDWRVWGQDQVSSWTGFGGFLGLRFTDVSFRFINKPVGLNAFLGSTGGEFDWRFWKFRDADTSMFIRIYFGTQSVLKDQDSFKLKKIDRLEAGLSLGTEIVFDRGFFFAPAVGILGGAYTKSDRKGLFEVLYISSQWNVGVKL